MRLSESDALPKNVSLQKAYTSIRRWNKANVDLFKSGPAANDETFIGLIEALPEVHELTDLEIHSVLIEFVSGNLEWGDHGSDCEYKMGAYASAGLDSEGRSSFTDEELEILRGSPLWPSLVWAQRASE